MRTWILRYLWWSGTVANHTRFTGRKNLFLPPRYDRVRSPITSDYPGFLRLMWTLSWTLLYDRGWSLIIGEFYNAIGNCPRSSTVSSLYYRYQYACTFEIFSSSIARQFSTYLKNYSLSHSFNSWNKVWYCPSFLLRRRKFQIQNLLSFYLFYWLLSMNSFPFQISVKKFLWTTIWFLLVPHICFEICFFLDLVVNFVKAMRRFFYAQAYEYFILAYFTQ